MGMFDEIRCEAALPDSGRTQDVYFQTKTFPCPCLQRYVITRAGRLVDSKGSDLEPDGYITFYTSDEEERASGNQGEGNWREYRARFSAGQLQSIVRVREDEQADRMYCGLASYRWFAAPSFLFGDP